MTKIQVPGNALNDIRTVESRTSRLERVSSQLVLRNINTVSGGSPLSDGAIDKLVFTNSSPNANPPIGPIQPTDGLLIEDSVNGFQLIRQSGHWVRFTSSYKPWGSVVGITNTFTASVRTPVLWNAANVAVGNGMGSTGRYFIVPTTGIYQVHTSISLPPFTPSVSGFFQVSIDWDQSGGTTFPNQSSTFGTDIKELFGGTLMNYATCQASLLIPVPLAAGATVQISVVSGYSSGGLSANGGYFSVTKYSD